MKDVLIIGAAAIAVFAVWRLSQPATSSPPTGARPSSPGNWSSLVEGAENLIQGRTGVPVASLGNAAVNAPTWLKVAVFPVGVTAVAQSTITHPVDTVKKVGSAISGAAHSVGSFVGGLF